MTNVASVRFALLLAACADAGAAPVPMPPRQMIDDVHVHLTNYIQQGISPRDLLGLMGDRFHRVAVFGIPLQQEWSYANSGDFAPTYYLDSDAPLYYYSFTDAIIATGYLELAPAQRARLDPMITGFNPADMYAVDHIKRVLRTFPGVFSGIGEFTVHKEFVSAKIAGGPASLENPALDRILDFAAESGLVVLLHNDLDRPFAEKGAEPAYFDQLQDLFRRHPKTTMIWAHVGLGRVIQPIPEYAAQLGKLLDDPRLNNLHFDISWIETAKYIVASEESVHIVADLISRHPDRFLYGSDEVAPADRAQLLEVHDAYAPLWHALAPAVREKVLRGNYERIFDDARRRVRGWEQADARRNLVRGATAHGD